MTVPEILPGLEESFSFVLVQHFGLKNASFTLEHEKVNLFLLKKKGLKVKINLHFRI